MLNSVYVVSIVSNPSEVLPVSAYETLEGVIEAYEIPVEVAGDFGKWGGSFSWEGNSYEWNRIPLFQKVK